MVGRRRDSRFSGMSGGQPEKEEVTYELSRSIFPPPSGGWVVYVLKDGVHVDSVYFAEEDKEKAEHWIASVTKGKHDKT